LLGIKHLIVCINKMDLVNYDEKVFESIKDEYISFASRIDIPDISFIPISAKLGDNVVVRSKNMAWYNGPTLLYELENIQVMSDYELVTCRFPVQYVIRPQKEEFHDFRAYAGRVAGGFFKKGDEVLILPAGFTTNIKAIHNMNKEVAQAFPPMSVSIELENDFDIGRGDMLVKKLSQPTVSQDVDIMICWFSEEPLSTGGKYITKLTLIHYTECRMIKISD